MSEKKYKSFKEFYPFYLSQHVNKTCRALHVIGSTLIVALIAYSLYTHQYMLMFAIPFVGYGFAWVGHFVFEKNIPATFTYPIYSLLGDWLMWWQVITFKIKL